LEEELAKERREVHRLNAGMAMANERLKRMATTDELTGLLNRREAMSRLQELWSARERYGHVYSCIMLDIDHFKKFNDTYGHAAGDLVLREFAGVLQGGIRATDVACRLGGEEFLVLCPGVDGRGAAVCADHIRCAVEAHDFARDQLHLKVTVSCGVSEWNGELANSDELLSQADAALYRAKEAGRNRVIVAGQATPISPA
jgi:two-component system, cell cycle response regulator